MKILHWSKIYIYFHYYYILVLFLNITTRSEHYFKAYDVSYLSHRKRLDQTMKCDILKMITYVISISGLEKQFTEPWV